MNMNNVEHNVMSNDIQKMEVSWRLEMFRWQKARHIRVYKIEYTVATMTN